MAAQACSFQLSVSVFRSLSSVLRCRFEFSVIEEADVMETVTKPERTADNANGKRRTENGKPLSASSIDQPGAHRLRTIRFTN
jgi:hypothetical protein